MGQIEIPISAYVVRKQKFGFLVLSMDFITLYPDTYCPTVGRPSMCCKLK
jgi:hypothetical protein